MCRRLVSGMWVRHPRAARAAACAFVAVLMSLSGIPAHVRAQTAGSPPSVATDERATLSRLNEDYVSSVLTSNVARFEQILASDFRNTNPDGSITDRAGFLAQVARPSNLRSLRAEDVEIRIFGDTAIIHARTVYESTEGRPGAGRYTDIWCRQPDGRWRAVAAHVTRAFSQASN